MSMSDIMVRFGADVEPLKKGTRQASSSLQEMRGKANVAATAFIGIATAAATAGAAMVKMGMDSAKEIRNLANAAGLGITEFQNYAFAARSAGIEQDKFADILKDVDDKIGDFIATGAGPMADFFENVGKYVGVTAEQFKKLNSREALQLYVETLEKANVSQKEMTFYMEAIASDSTMLLPLLRDNGKAMAEMAGQAESLGYAMSEIDSAKIEQAEQALARGKMAGEAMTQQLAVQFAPVLQGLSDLFYENAEGAAFMQTAVEKTFDIVIGGAKIGANAMRGIHVIIKGLELGFHAMSVVINRVLQAIPESVDFVVNLAKQSINNYIIALNKLPNVAIPLLEQSTSAATTFFQNTTDTAKASMQQTRDELDVLLMRPLPGDALQEWIDKVQETSQKAAEEIARTREEALGLNVNELPDPAEDPRIAYEQAAQNGIIGVLVNSLDVMDKVSKDAAQKRLDTQTWFAAESINAYSNMFGNISSLMQSENKRMFEIGKAAAVSQAVIDTIASAQAAFKSLAGIPVVGPALGAAAAGAATLAGIARVNQISSASFGQKSAPSGGGGGGSVGATSAVGPQQAAPSQTMYVEGLNGDQLFSGTMVRSLVEKIDEYRKDGGAVVLV